MVGGMGEGGQKVLVVTKCHKSIMYRKVTIVNKSVLHIENC